MTELHPNAKALLRLAKSAQDPTRSELDFVVSEFERRASETPLAQLFRPETLAPPGESAPAASGVSPVLLRRASRRGRFRVLRWSLMAAIMTGSLGAFANWALVVEQVRHTFTLIVSEVLDLPASNPELSKPKRLPASAHRETISPEGSALAPFAPDAPSAAEAVPTEGAVVDFASVEVPAAPVGPGEGPKRPPRPPVSNRSIANPAIADSSTSAVSGARAADTNGGRDDLLVEEVNLIGNARSALSSGNYLLTRRLLAEHQSSFPRGTLTEERETLSAIAACRESGNAELARRYVERRPHSLFAARLRRECGLDTEALPRPEP